MSPPNSSVLQDLEGLDRFSHDFPKQLSDLLYSDGYIKCHDKPGLQDGDPEWLVEYLDQVCHHIALLHSPPINRYRFSELSIAPVAFSASAYASSGKYVALGKSPLSRTRLSLRV
jgi:hypothetical protein